MRTAVEALGRRLPVLEPCLESLEAAISLVATSLRAEGKVLVCGNGGSASDSEHLVADLMKGFTDPEGVVLGSLAVRAGDLFLPVVRAVVAKETVGNGSASQIVASELGEAIGDVAALSGAIYHGQLGPFVGRAAG